MASTHEETEVIDNESASRFELLVEGQVAVLEYIRREGSVIFVHTGVPKELEGKGIAGMLAKHALQDARRRGLKVVPRCPYVAAYIDRHPEFADLVASGTAGQQGGAP